MGGINLITSSIFVQRGVKAIFESGISSSNVESRNNVFAKTYDNFKPPVLLKVGSASLEGDFKEWETTTGTTVRLSASGNFNHFTFIEKQPLGWFQISTGSQKGLVEKSFVNITKDVPGVYEYLVIAMSTESKQTITKGTTITVI